MSRRVNNVSTLSTASLIFKLTEGDPSAVQPELRGRLRTDGPRGEARGLGGHPKGGRGVLGHQRSRQATKVGLCKVTSNFVLTQSEVYRVTSN